MVRQALSSKYTVVPMRCMNFRTVESVTHADYPFHKYWTIIYKGQIRLTEYVLTYMRDKQGASSGLETGAADLRHCIYAHVTCQRQVPLSLI
jgi:hypothetical protein